MLPLAAAAAAVLLLLFDLLVVNHPRRPSSRSRAVLCAIAYFALALVSARAVYYYYLHHPLPGLEPAELSMQYLGALLLMVALDLDTVFVFTAVFTHLNTPQRLRHRALMWGILAALLTRGGLIFATGWALDIHPSVKFVLAGLLLLAAVRMLLIRQEKLEPDGNLIIRVLRKTFPTTASHSEDWFSTVKGRWALTPLLITVVLLETGDTLFALDAVPAVFAVTRVPALVFAASIFSLLVIRSLHDALSGLTAWIRFLKVGLACVIGYAAVLICLPPAHRPTTAETLAVISLSVGAGLVVALVSRRPGPTPKVSALGEEADEFARATLRHGRRVIVFVFGITALAIGAFMLVGPGPGIPVVFIALAVLGSEFTWARRLMEKYREAATHAALKTAEHARRRFKPWILIPMIGATAAAIVALAIYTPVPLVGLIISGAFVVAGQLAWGYLAFFRKHPETPALPAATGSRSEPPSRTAR